MTAPPPHAVQPLHLAEDRFLQVLLSRFTLTRYHGFAGPRFELSVEFDDNVDAIWDRNGKTYLRSILTADKRNRFQKSLDEFFAGGGTNPLSIDDPDFFFRYASGGTLVTVEFDGDSATRYYCFFYRDVHPIGWNIANGGTDSRAELLNPQETIDRELREELIIADFDNRVRYVFPGDEGTPFDHPAHAAARQLWKRKFPDRDLDTLRATPIDLEWELGPDSLNVKMGHDTTVRREGFYLNINGRDFGIEFDRIVTVRGLPRESVRLFDGELDGGRLVGSPVALFEVDRFDRRLQLGEISFEPDFFYFRDVLYETGSAITAVLRKEFIEHVRTIRPADEIRELEVAINAKTHLGLCPVTKKIAKRYFEGKSRS